MKRASLAIGVLVGLASTRSWALSIANVRVVNRSDVQVTVLWDTDVAASSEVRITLEGGVEQVVMDDELVSAHAITIGGLAAAADYTLVVVSDGSMLDGPAFTTAPPPTYLRYAEWPAGPPSDPSFFPVHVWLQSPGNAGEFTGLGIDFFTGLYNGPTDEQLATLAAANMPVICDQNEVALASPDVAMVWGWSQQDEPDNAQSDGMGGYLPCIDPQVIVDGYAAMKAADPTRPVFLNVGQSVAWDLDDPWVGRGECTGQWDDYAAYFQGADIISFDIYPVTNGSEQINGELWRVALGVDRLREWGPDKIVWNWIETTYIDSPNLPTPHDVRAEVWMSLVHGSMGIGYFVHEFAPAFREDGIFNHPEIVDAVTAINAEIHELAPVLNAASMQDALVVTSSDANVPVDAMVKRHEGATYVFAVAMRDDPTTATFELFAHSTAMEAEVIGEDRMVAIEDGSFTDDFVGYDVHLYRIVAALDGSDGSSSDEGGADTSEGGSETVDGSGSESAGMTADGSGSDSSGGIANDDGNGSACGCRAPARVGPLLGLLGLLVLVGSRGRTRRLPRSGGDDLPGHGHSGGGVNSRHAVSMRPTARSKNAS